MDKGLWILIHKSTFKIWILHVLSVSVCVNGSLRNACVFSASAISIYEHINIISKTAVRVTSWAFDHLIWENLPSYHTQQERKGLHSNQSKSKFGLALSAIFLSQFLRVMIVLLTIKLIFILISKKYLPKQLLEKHTYSISEKKVFIY